MGAGDLQGGREQHLPGLQPCPAVLSCPPRSLQSSPWSHWHSCQGSAHPGQGCPLLLPQVPRALSFPPSGHLLCPHVYRLVPPNLASPARLTVHLVSLPGHGQTCETGQAPGQSLWDSTGCQSPGRYDPVTTTSEPDRPAGYLPTAQHPAWVQGHCGRVKVHDIPCSPLVHKSSHCITDNSEMGEAFFTLGQAMLAVPHHLLLHVARHMP